MTTPVPRRFTSSSKRSSSLLEEQEPDVARPARHLPRLTIARIPTFQQPSNPATLPGGYWGRPFATKAIPRILKPSTAATTGRIPLGIRTRGAPESFLESWLGHSQRWRLNYRAGFYAGGLDIRGGSVSLSVVATDAAGFNSQRKGASDASSLSEGRVTARTWVRLVASSRGSSRVGGRRHGGALHGRRGPLRPSGSTILLPVCLLVGLRERVGGL